MKEKQERNPHEVKQDSQGENTTGTQVMRAKDGKWLKGTPSPNPAGRPKNNFRKRLNEMFGSDSSELVLKLSEIAFYDQKAMKDRFPKYKAADILKATELLLAYQQGKPTQHIEAEVETKSVNINLTVPNLDI